MAVDPEEQLRKAYDALPTDGTGASRLAERARHLGARRKHLRAAAGVSGGLVAAAAVTPIALGGGSIGTGASPTNRLQPAGQSVGLQFAHSGPDRGQVRHLGNGQLTAGCQLGHRQHDRQPQSGESAVTTTDFEDFVERETARLRKLAVSLTGNRIDADDLLQETFTQGLRVVGQGACRFVVDGPRATDDAAHLPVRTSTPLIRRDREPDRRRSGHRPGSGRGLRAASCSAGPGRAPACAAAGDRRAALHGDLPVAEVASIMRMREGAVRTACHRALAALRAETVSSAERSGMTATARSSYAT